MYSCRASYSPVGESRPRNHRHCSPPAQAAEVLFRAGRCRRRVPLRLVRAPQNSVALVSNFIVRFPTLLFFHTDALDRSALRRFSLLPDGSALLYFADVIRRERNLT